MQGMSGTGIFTYRNGDWNEANNGLTDTNVYALAIDPPDADHPVCGHFGRRRIQEHEPWRGSGAKLIMGWRISIFIPWRLMRRTSNTLYAGTDSGGVFKTTNGGQSWTEANSGLGKKNVHILAIDPQTPTTLYAGTLDGGVFKSMNGGGSWRAVNTGLTNKVAYTLAIDPLTPATLYAGIWSDGVFKSMDGGGKLGRGPHGLDRVRGICPCD